MLSIATPERRYVGLSPHVLYRLELSFAIVDDGERVFRFRRGLFTNVIESSQNRAATAAEERFVREHPSVFSCFSKRGAARESLLYKEI